jgi:hypothetical protein
VKGVVFTEFVEMVENQFSPELADTIITEADLPSGGIYTSVGTYAHEEFLLLVARLAEHTGTAPPDLQRRFGQYLFRRFLENHPQYFDGMDSAFDFLKKVEDHIHVEVRKLYPDAELPSFYYESPRPDCLYLTYQSSRPFASLAEGLIRGCIEHFGESIEVKIKDLSKGQGNAARFLLIRKPSFVQA